MEDIRLTEEDIAKQEKLRHVEISRNRFRLIGLMAGIIPVVFITVITVIIAIPFGQASQPEFLQYFLLPIGVIIVSVAIAWKQALVGGIILVIVSLLWTYFWWSRNSTPSSLDIVVWLALLFLPPLIAGILFILSWRIGKKLNEPQNPPLQY